MKKIFNSLLFIIILSSSAIGQDCNEIVKVCESYLNGKEGSSRFISDGQVYTAFLDREKAEFRTTFYGGSTYRVVASAGNDDDFVIFTIKDLKGNIIFTNKNHKNSPYWDFVIPSTIPVIIVTELDLDKKVTGCAVMLIGFKQ
ncbi:MAG: hypothetical protein HYR91_00640 [Flavobacteriia bacterium]|nr:hypothetical protein [Flavobacteriia bacterium]